MRVSIVEDDQDIAGLLAAVIEKLGFEPAVHLVERGDTVASVLQRLAAASPDAIILDVDMPVSGFAIADAVARDSTFDAATLVIASADPENADLAWKRPRVIAMTKPYEVAQLRDVLKKT